MIKKTCENCQYFREESWCSNFESMNYRYDDFDNQKFVAFKDTCKQFTERGKKANFFLRGISRIMKGRK